MKTIKDIRNFFIFGNVWLSCCAVAQGMLTYKLIHQPFSYSVLLVLFLATFFLYNFRGWFNKESIEKHKEEGTSEHMRWMAFHTRTLSVLSIIALVVMVPFVFLLQVKTMAVLCFTALLTLGYTLPVFTSSKGLRHLPGLKTFLVALVWALSVVLVPIVESTVSLDPVVLIVLFLKRFFLLFTLALLFDIRDEQTDKENKLHTIATYLGANRTRILCLVLLIVQLLLLYGYDYALNMPLFFILSLYTLLCAAVVWGGKYNKSVFYYFFLVDGMMILQYVMVSMVK